MTRAFEHIGRMKKAKVETHGASRLLQRLTAHKKSPTVYGDAKGTGEQDGQRQHTSQRSRSRSPTAGSRHSSHHSSLSDGRSKSSSRRRSRKEGSHHSHHSERSRREHHGETSGEQRRRHRHRSHSTNSVVSSSGSRSNSEPPAWASEILANQKKNTEELQRLQAEVTAVKSTGANNHNAKASCPSTTLAASAPKVDEQPDFRYEGNKTQYNINKRVLDHVNQALASSDMSIISKELNEGKKLLSQRNKHILLAEKYGWDTVQCYTAEPLASDSEDEKKIKKAIKEGNRLKNEKARQRSRRQFRPNDKNYKAQPINQATRATKYASQPTPSRYWRDTRDTRVTCFRCSKPGHISRECRSANSRFVIASANTANTNNNST